MTVSCYSQVPSHTLGSSFRHGYLSSIVVPNLGRSTGVVLKVIHPSSRRIDIQNQSSVGDHVSARPPCMPPSTCSDNDDEEKLTFTHGLLAYLSPKNTLLICLSSLLHIIYNCHHSFSILVSSTMPFSESSEYWNHLLSAMWSPTFASSFSPPNAVAPQVFVATVFTCSMESNIVCIHRFWAHNTPALFTFSHWQSWQHSIFWKFLHCVLELDIDVS